MVNINLDQITAAAYVDKDTTDHPCGECTLCRTPIVEGTEYDTWEVTSPGSHGVLEHVCRDCDMTLRMRFLLYNS